MLGDKIKKLRNQKNIYQQTLADALSVSKSTVAMWETNKREPDNLMMRKIAEYFEVSTDYFLSDSIKFNFFLRELDDDEATITCPICGYDCTHFTRTLNVDFENEKSNGIAIEFFCEADHNFYLVIESYKGNSYFAFTDDTCKIKCEHDSPVITAPVSAAELWSTDVQTNKYDALDTYGKQAVDSILEFEYNRCTANDEPEEKTIEIKHSCYKVSAGLGFTLGSGDDWETISIPDTPEARKADYALTIYGSSMEPVYFDGDIVLVKAQEAIDIGEIGIYTINGEGFIKKYGGDRLISLNANYDDIFFDDNDTVQCRGKVIGRI